MNYKAIVLYNISDNELRDMFTKELSERHFIKHQDQSTYALPDDGYAFDISSFHGWLSEWCLGKPWAKDDFMSVYYLDRKDRGSESYTIKNRFYPTKEK